MGGPRVPDRKIVHILLGFVAGAAVGGGTYALVDSLASEPRRPAAAPSEPRRVSGINPPSHYVAEAREDVADVLARVATIQQRVYERTGAYPLISPEVTTIAVPSGVLVRSIHAEEAAFCIEAAHSEIPGTRLRFISVTGEIDAGRCDSERPLAEQVGDDVAAQSGGHMEFTNVRLVKRPPPASSPEHGRRYVLVFDATWEGPGLPEDQECSYRLLDAEGRVVYDGEWGVGFSTESTPLVDYKAMTFFGKSQLEGEVPADVELDCRNAW